MTPQQSDRIDQIGGNLKFLSAMILAWDTDAIEIGAVEKDGIWYFIECIHRELMELQA